MLLLQVLDARLLSSKFLFQLLAACFGSLLLSLSCVQLTIKQFDLALQLIPAP